MFGFDKKPLNRNQPSPESEWQAEPMGIDAIVFVHGILGDKTKAWGKFPELLQSDPELPAFDVLCWGYQSGLIPGSYKDVETEADSLMSDLRQLLADDEDIYLVAHSMGGLVSLKGIVRKILNGEGKVHPVSSIKLVTLYATPLHGSGVADVVAFAAGLSRYSRMAMKVLPGDQLEDLRKGEFVQSLLVESNEHIYRPLPENTLVNNRIRVQACTAKRDAVVSKQSAIGIFAKNPSPIHLEGTHTSVKEPDHHLDQRYLAFKSNLNEGLKDSFTRLSQRALNDPDKAVKLQAVERFDQQYGRLLKRCVSACFPGIEPTDRNRRAIAASMLDFGARGGRTPEEVVRCVIRDYRYTNEPPLPGDQA